MAYGCFPGCLIILVLLLVLCDIQIVSATHMRGGSISWRALSNNSVEISYWLAWRHDFEERGHEPCTYEHYLDHSVRTFGEELKYKDPSLTDYVDVYDIAYRCTDYNPDVGWVAGSGKFIYTSDTQDFTISMKTCCWVSLMNFVVPRDIRLTTGIDLTEYSSSGGINNSPVAYTLPLQRVQQTCNALIQILVSDPDGDDVRCRWANNNERKDDCDNVCGPLPSSVQLHKRECKLSMENVDLAPGKYAVTIMVEDFISKRSKKKLSKVPLQFILEILTYRDCAVPHFIAPTPLAGICYPYPAGEPIHIRIAARTSNPTRPISEIASLGLPLGMTKSAITQVDGVSTDYYVDLHWTPTADDIGNHQMCFIAQDTGANGDSYASEQTCITINVGGSLVYVVPEDSFPSPGGIVPSRTSELTWIIRFDHEIVLPIEPARVVFLTALGGQVVDAATVHKTVNLTHGSLTPDRHGIILNTTEFMLEPHMEYTIRVDGGAAESFRKGCGYLLSEPAEWNFFASEDHIQHEEGRRPPEGIRMARPKPECHNSFMVIYIPKLLVGDIDPTKIRLQDSLCIGSYHNQTHYSIGSSYGLCGTSVHEGRNSEGELVYHHENIIQIPSLPYFNESNITRRHRIEIHVSCIMANRRPVVAEFNPNVTTIVYHESAYGEFQFSLYMCRDDTFDYKYRSNEFPVDVDLQNRLFFEARQYHSGDTGIFLQSCRATPTSNPSDDIYYEFLKDGCPVDDTVIIHEPPNSRKARFSIQAFSFLGHFIGATVFVHCEMSVCMLSDPECNQICNIHGGEELEGAEANVAEDTVVETNHHDIGSNGRLPLAKRDVADTNPTSMSYTNTDGPIKLRPNLQGSTSKGGATSELKYSKWFSKEALIEISLVTLNLLVLLLVLIIVIRVYAVIRHKTSGGEKSHTLAQKVCDPITLDMNALSKQR